MQVLAELKYLLLKLQAHDKIERLRKYKDTTKNIPLIGQKETNQAQSTHLHRNKKM